ncbi:MAG: fibronectin type III-like domain-contianing protein [Paraglaciecola sp.]|nr:fibronectin type III-like domain-contianing protein [Paraglaciecola sp.]
MIAGINWGKPAEVFYQEGIFVGYRYFDTFDVDVAYPFGYGLSYTSFNFASEKSGKTLDVSDKITFPVTVTNTGAIAGKQIMQLYVSAPLGKLAKPKKELKAFAKTRLLKPAESQTLVLAVNKSELASFDPELRAWVVDKGDYQFHLATSVDDVVLSASLNIKAAIVVQEVIADLRPKDALNEMDFSHQ